MTTTESAATAAFAPVAIVPIVKHRKKRTYDHRLREHVIRNGRRSFPDLDIPASTARTWMRNGPAQVVTVDLFDQTPEDHVQSIANLQHRVAVLTAVLVLLLAILRVSGFRLENTRLPSGKQKTDLLRSVNTALKTLALNSVLRIIHLSPARYHSWNRGASSTGCSLDDASSCPRFLPARLTFSEIATMKEMVTSIEYRHIPISSLAYLAMRLGTVFAAPATWLKLARDKLLRRPRLRLYPPKPKIGLLATHPNQYWHLDVTIVRLLDHTRVYIHGIVDNYSRKVLAWLVTDHLDPFGTCRVLIEAAKLLTGDLVTPILVVDSGVENLNQDVDDFIDFSSLVHKVIAQVEIVESNSKIEAFFRSLKHQWLFLHQFVDIATVHRLVAFYVEQHNAVIPHYGFKGQTPDEMYFGTGAFIPSHLHDAHHRAIHARIKHNRSLTCTECPDSSPRPPPQTLTP